MSEEQSEILKEQMSKAIRALPESMTTLFYMTATAAATEGPEYNREIRFLQRLFLINLDRSSELLTNIRAFTDMCKLKYKTPPPLMAKEGDNNEG